jgi:hypothetical protein
MGGMVAMMGVANPAPLIITAGRQSQVDLHLLLALSTISRRSSTGPASQAQGQERRTREPEQAQAQVQGSGVGAAGPEHGAGHSFL